MIDKSSFWRSKKCSGLRLIISSDKNVRNVVRLKISVAFSEVCTEWGPLWDDVLTIVH